MRDLTGTVVLVSGAGRGIGRAVAERLYARGCHLSLGVRNEKSIQPFMAEREAARLMSAPYHAEHWASHEAWVAATLARFGRIDALVNNAGISVAMPLMQADEAKLDHIWAVNCKAPLNLARLCLPHLEATGQGRIVNVASLSGKRVRGDNVAYQMSKFAVVALTHALRRISWDKGVRATALCPSYVRTDMTSSVREIAAADMTDPADLAELVATIMALPNTASIAELLVNCRLEDMV